MTNFFKKQKINFAVVGTGFGTSVHLPGLVLHPKTNPIAVCTPRRSRADEVKNKFSLDYAFTDIDDLVHLKKIDAVVLATPPSTHFELAMKIIKSGKSLILEKPMAINFNEASQLHIETAKKKQVYMINHEFRYFPARLYLKDLLEKNHFGKIFHITCNTFYETKTSRWHWWQPGGGLLEAIGSHMIDSLINLFGDFSSVIGELETIKKIRHHKKNNQDQKVLVNDSFSFMARLKNGALVTCTGNSAAKFEFNNKIHTQYTVYGSQNTAKIDSNGDLWVGNHDSDHLEKIDIPDIYHWAPCQGHYLTSPYLKLLDDFTDNYLHEESKGPLFIDGLKHQQIIDIIHQSSKEKRWIDVPPLY